MTNINIIHSKISDIKKYLQILEQYKSHSLEAIEQDVTIKGAVERYIYLAAQATIDTAEAVVAYKKLRKPQTYGEAFEILKEAEILTPSQSESLIAMTGFRNVLAHDYAGIDMGIIYNALQKRLADIETFIDSIEKKIQ
jgi:uncharacterized protein YutE (UPF0331/DUF86 family)